jgi:glycosyltransferase involved in cell wall biosynthesis
MNICFLCDEYPPGPHGGIGSFTQTLGRMLAAHGHRVTALGLYPIDQMREDNDQGVRVIRLPMAMSRGAGVIVNRSRLARALMALGGELELVEGPELSMVAVPRSLRAARVIRMNGGHSFFMTALGQKPLTLRGWLERRSFARAHQLCAVSHYVAETTRRLLKLGDRPIEILPNPVNTEYFRPRPEITEEEGLIVFVGTVAEKKGVRQLIQAMPEITAAVPAAKLLIIGRDSRDSLTKESYTAQLRQALPAGLAERIEFRGSVENADLPALLARASVCVYPSHIEAQGIVIVEGMAMGKAVVTSRTGPGPEIVEDGISGLLCDPHDPQSIAAQVVRALKDEQLRQRLGASARQRAVERFSASSLVKQNESFYERCLSAGYLAYAD